jgi:hypothetical protein
MSDGARRNKALLTTCPGHKPHTRIRDGAVNSLVSAGEAVGEPESRGTTVASRRPSGVEGQTGPAFCLQPATGESRRPSGGALIAVMKAADLRDRHDAPASWGLHLASVGAVVVEGLMRAGGVVVREVPAQ